METKIQRMKELIPILREAAKAGIYVLVYDCMVREDHVQMDQRISVVLN